MDGIDDVVLLWFELGILGKSHSLVVSDVNLGKNWINSLHFSFPVVERLLFSFSSVDRLNQPDLISSLMDVVLNHRLVVLCFSSTNIETSSGMSLDDISLVSKRSFF